MMKSIIELVKSTGDIVEDLNNREMYINSNNWISDNHTFFYIPSISDNTNIHYDGNEIYGLSISFIKDDYVYIHMFEVNSSLRNKGYGRLMMEEIITDTINKGIHKIKLYSLLDTIGFYEKMGFKNIKSGSMEFKHR